MSSCSSKTYPRFSSDGHEATTGEYMITTQGKASSAAGVEILKAGGNIVDAAVAISFAIGVERPQSTGLGGGGFMLMAGGIFSKPMSLDFREKAPLKSDSKMYLNENGAEIKGKSINGIHAVAIPGLVAGLIEIHEKYGKLSLAQVMSPAIELAEKGFKIYPHLASAIKSRVDVIKLFPSSRKIFFNAKNMPLTQGELLVQDDLAKTLKLIASKGREAFYHGEIAKKIVATSKKYKGILSQEDFDKYEAKWREPLMSDFKGFNIISMAPPSSGGVHVIEILNILENFKLSENGTALSANTVHHTASAMQQAFADRAEYLGDADFTDVPSEILISKDYAFRLSKNIEPKRAKSALEVRAGDISIKESSDTTHFTIMSKDGSTISSTQTINGLLGSALVAEGTGIVLNNEMDDFAVKVGASNLFGAVGGEKNLIEPQKKPLSSMSPTIVMKKKQPVLALGTPNGTKIITCTALTILNYLEYKMSLYDSVHALRYHQQWHPDEIRVEEPGFPKDVNDELLSFGHKIKVENMGCKVQAIAKEDNILHGVSDTRGEGLAIGY